MVLLLNINFSVVHCYHRNKIKFCVLTLYPTALLNSPIGTWILLKNLFIYYYFCTIGIFYVEFHVIPE